MPNIFDDYAPYRPFLDSGQFTHCIHGALELLKSIKEMSEAQFRTAHKGTPFYVMGFAAFASHDYSAASLFFDAAVEEDLTNFPGRPDSPALLFMQLDASVDNQLAHQIVVQVSDNLIALIRDYNGR